MSRMDRDTRHHAAQWLAEGHPAIVLEVTEARGSVPRGAGTRMLVGPAQTAGTIGGGHLEWEAIRIAREMLAAGPVRAARVEQYALGPALGQCCGGSVTLAWRPLDATTLARWPGPVPLCHLQLFGAGHVGRAIAALLCTLDVVVDWIDEREDAFPLEAAPGRPWPAHIRRVCVDTVEAEVRLAPPQAFYLVLTHQHDLDMRIAEAVLRRGDFGFLGLIGSKTKRQRFIHRFEARGVAPQAIARMTCPIGVEGIEGKQPEVIAVAVVAQLLQRAGA
jgi:xanthine dehydrogenase accessory factor